MHLLAEPESSAVERALAENAGARRGLAEVQAKLAVFAEASVDLTEAPEGSLDRLMVRVAREKRVLPMPVQVAARPTGMDRMAAKQRGGVAGRVLPWIGWAVAAGLTVAVGTLYRDRMELHRMLTAQTGQVVHMSADTTEGYRERDAMQATIANQAKALDALRADAAAAGNERAGLQATMAGQTAKLNEQTAKLSGAETRANNVALEAANAAHERDVLRGTLAAQANQVSQLTTDEARSRQVLEALNDPTALRVTLTRPKTSVPPTGHATYVASRGTLVFLANNLLPLKPNKVYELWLMPADGAKPVPVQTFSPDARGNASVVFAQFPRAVAAKGFAVTVENAGGSQTPTLPILLTGA